MILQEGEINMNIINVVEDSVLGSLICFANEKLQPIYWGKYFKYQLFLKESEIPFLFHLYFCNENFNTIGWKEETVNEWKKMLWNVYQEFLKNGNIVEDILFNEILDGIFLEEEGFEEEEVQKYQKKYKIKEELFKDVTVIEVRIHLHNYTVIASLPFKKEKIAIVVWNIFDKEKRYGYLISEEESEPVEMDYGKEREYLLLTCKE